MTPQEKLQNIEDSLNEYGQGCITPEVTGWMIARIRELEATLQEIKTWDLYPDERPIVEKALAGEE